MRWNTSMPQRLAYHWTRSTGVDQAGHRHRGQQQPFHWLLDLVGRLFFADQDGPQRDRREMPAYTQRLPIIRTLTRPEPYPAIAIAATPAEAMKCSSGAERTVRTILIIG